MEWIKLNKDYPLAYSYMEAQFKCLYSIKCSNYSTGNLISLSVKHPLKRDLYDFFDNEHLFVEIWFDTEQFGYKVIHDSFISSQIEFNTRSQAETEAFGSAFEILNKRLIDEQ